jgi:hypothetical protein
MHKLTNDDITCTVARKKNIEVPDEPLWLDVCAGPDVVFGGEDELVVEHPLGLVVQACRGVQLHHLHH